MSFFVYFGTPNVRYFCLASV